MKLSEILRDKSIDVDNEMLEMVAGMAEELEVANERLRDKLTEHAEYDHKGTPINWCANALAEESNESPR